MLQTAQKALLPGVYEAATPAELSVLTRPDCAAVVWPRCPPEAFQSWLDSLPWQRLPSARVILRPQEVRRARQHVDVW